MFTMTLEAGLVPFARELSTLAKGDQGDGLVPVHEVEWQGEAAHRKAP
jgi:hypothetical protein